MSQSKRSSASSSPSKIVNYASLTILSLIFEQERQHWLLKPNKKLTVQDAEKGSIYVGKLDNMGNEIIAETCKNGVYTGADLFTFTQPMINDIFDINASVLPYNNSLNGLMTMIMKSTKVAYNLEYKTYKLKLVDCDEVIIPIADSSQSGDVYATKWIKTKTVPSILLPDNNNEYTIEIKIPFESEITGCTYYYPIEDNMRPLQITNLSAGTYVLEAPNSDDYIGYPTLWFTSDNTNVGPTVSISNNTVNQRTLMYVSNPGDVSKYNPCVYCNIDGTNDATPDASETSSWKIQVESLQPFTTNVSPEDIPINMSSIKFIQKYTNESHIVGIIPNNSNETVMTISNSSEWNIDIGTNVASIDMSVFDSNCYSIFESSPLKPIFNLSLDETVTFNLGETDIGYAGIDMSAEISSETTERYPHGLNEHEGLPEWIQNNELGVPQRTVVYAIKESHDGSDNQVAGLMLDPGKPKTSESEEYTNDERGRVYVLSNDPAEYVNNDTAENPKPGATAARICDIPTSLVKLTNIAGLSPTTVVDKSYVHTDAPYTTEEKNVLYNTLTSRWVRPIHLDATGKPIKHGNTSKNDFIFTTVTDLESVDLINHNNFRQTINLNPVVDPNEIGISSIANPGSNYSIGDFGVIIIGGVSLNYTINNIMNGAVTGVVLTPPSSNQPINISNFDLTDETSGITKAYGTSPLNGTGTGLSLIFKIMNYSTIRTQLGNVFDDLFALVKLVDGLWLYKYFTNGTGEFGSWEKQTMISEAESSSIITSLGGLSNTESYMTSIIPIVRSLPTYEITTKTPTSIMAFTTPSSVNVIDTEHIPFTPPIGSVDTEPRHTIDMNGLFGTPFRNGVSKYHSVSSIIDYLDTRYLLDYDTYLIFKFDDVHDTSNNNFTYSVVRRGFNNFVSTDTTTTLPNNALNYKSFVHTNEQTTLVWNVPGFGPMMWIYDPKSTIYETYTIDAETHELTISRAERTWEDIKFVNDKTKIIDDNGDLMYHIYTNNRLQSNFQPTPKDPIYQQPVFTYLGNVGVNIKHIQKPIGVWRLIHPRVNTYTLQNQSNGLTFDAIKMDVIRGSQMGFIGDVKNINGDIVNKKILAMDTQNDGVKLRSFNPLTRKWDII